MFVRWLTTGKRLKRHSLKDNRPLQPVKVSAVPFGGPKFLEHVGNQG